MISNLTIQGILALLTVGGALALFMVSAFVKPLDPAIINTVSPLAVMVLGWYFGSSKSSQDKDATIAAQMIPQNNDPASTTSKTEITKTSETKPNDWAKP